MKRARCDSIKMKAHKEAEMAQVLFDLKKERQETQKLLAAVREREVQIAYLLSRCSYLDEAASYAPLLDQLSQCLKSAFQSPPPKIQTVSQKYCALLIASCISSFQVKPTRPKDEQTVIQKTQKPTNMAVNGEPAATSSRQPQPQAIQMRKQPVLIDTTRNYP